MSSLTTPFSKKIRGNDFSRLKVKKKEENGWQYGRAGWQVATSSAKETCPSRETPHRPWPRGPSPLIDARLRLRRLLSRPGNSDHALLSDQNAQQKS
jgi:hypothetical protein